MTSKVLIAHAKGEQELAEQLAGPIRSAGYQVAHEGTVLVGESIVDEVSKLLVEGVPVVLCGTVRAVGTGKSTLLRWLATAYLLRLQNHPDWRGLPDIADLPDRDWLPILIRCRDLPPGVGTLDEMLQHSLRKSELAADQCTELADLLRTRLARGEALPQLEYLAHAMCADGVQ